MESLVEIFSKFKNNLGSFIDEYKNKVAAIEEEEKFISTLGDVINYSKNDISLLPFYDETVLVDVFSRVFPLSSNEINKIKTAKYLIEASKFVDTEHFLQYNNAIKEVENIFNKINSFYEKKISDDSMKADKDNYEGIISSYSSIYDRIDDGHFNSLIDDVDLFEKVINDCGLDINEVNIILNVAIVDNLNYLDSNGVINVDVHNDIADLKEENSKIQSDIRNLNDLLGE